MVPAHIPSQLVRDFDIYSLRGFEGDLFEEWKKLQDEYPPLFYTPSNGGHWVATRARLTEKILGENSLFSSAVTVPPLPPGVSPMPPIHMDLPVHREFRALINPWFAPKSLRDLTARARKLASELVDGLHDRGCCEFVSDFAMHLPIGVFLGMAGLPMSDREWLLERAELIRMENPADREREYIAIQEYLGQAIDARRRSPTDDILSSIVHGKINGRGLSDEEVLGECTVVLLGGLDTVASMLGFIARYLATHDEFRKQLCTHLERIPDATQELLRRHSVASTPRVASADLELDGVAIKKGDRLWIGTWFHSLDETQWEDSLTVDIDRDNSELLTFGTGIHRCPGAALARNEISVFLDQWLRKIPDFWIAPTETSVAVSGSVNAMIRLPLAWK